LTAAAPTGYRTSVVRVVQRGRFSVYVYAEAGQPHHQPHCHVYWRDGESVVDLVRLSVLAGQPLPPAARELIRDHLVDITNAWTLLNPTAPRS
jgi:hypothetical protein